VTVDAKILNKSGALEDDEWTLIRRHPEEGARIAWPLREWLGEWSLAIAQHHERWDGSGYPRGLKGEEISLAARIVAVADSYDAMTSLRSYQKAMPPAEARAEITRGAGVHYDPAVVRAFLRVSRGRVTRVLGPMSWLAMVPLAGTGVASAATATARRAQTAAAIAGGGGAVAAAAALGIVGPATGSAALARHAPVVAAAPAPAPEVRVLPADSVTPVPPTPEPAAAAAPAPAATAPVPPRQAFDVPTPVAGSHAPAPIRSVGPPAATGPTSDPPPPSSHPDPPPPPPSSEVQVNAAPLAQVTVSTRQPLPVCVPIDAGVVKVRC
jgi:hypothetical protein